MRSAIHRTTSKVASLSCLGPDGQFTAGELLRSRLHPLLQDQSGAFLCFLSREQSLLLSVASKGIRSSDGVMIPAQAGSLRDDLLVKINSPTVW